MWARSRRRPGTAWAVAESSLRAAAGTDPVGLPRQPARDRGGPRRARRAAERPRRGPGERHHVGAEPPDVWHLLVAGRGWTPEQWEAWFADTLAAQLLDRGGDRGG